MTVKKWTADQKLRVRHPIRSGSEKGGCLPFGSWRPSGSEGNIRSRDSASGAEDRRGRFFLSWQVVTMSYLAKAHS